MSRDNEFWLWRALKDVFRRSPNSDKSLDVEFSVPIERELVKVAAPVETEPSDVEFSVPAKREPIESPKVAQTPPPSPRRNRRPILNRLAIAETPPSADSATALRKFLTRKQNEYRTIWRLANDQYDYSYRQDLDGKWTHHGVYSWRFSLSYTLEPFEPSKLPYRKLYSEKKDLRFFFEADCPPSSPRYWLAELAIPPFASDLTVLRLKVTDVAGRPLVVVCRKSFGFEPYFAFGPQGYQIQDGFTPLTLRVFQNYFIKQTQIGVLFNGQLSPGSLRLLDAETVAQTRAARS